MQSLKNDGDTTNGLFRQQSNSDHIRGTTKSQPRSMSKHEHFQTLWSKPDDLQQEHLQIKESGLRQQIFLVELSKHRIQKMLNRKN